MDAFDKLIATGKPDSEPDAFDRLVYTTAQPKREPIEVDATKLANTGRPVASFFHGMSSGATFGGADKLNAFIDSIVKGTKYDDELKAWRGAGNVMAEEYPKTHFAGELAGGVATGIPASAPVMAAKSIPMLGRLAITGAGAGALSGAGASEAPDWQGVAEDTGKGLVLGGALAPLLGVAGNAVLRGGAKPLSALGAAGGTAGALYGAMEGEDLTTTGGYALGGALGLPALAWGGNKALTAATDLGGKLMGKLTGGANSYAVRKIEEALARGEMTPDEARTVLNQLGPESMLADINNPNIRMLAESVTTRPGKPAAQADKFLDERAARETQAVRDATKQATGQPGNYYQTLDDLNLQRTKAAEPLYKEAYTANLQMESPEINRLLETPAGKQALKAAAERMGNRMSYMSESDPELTALKNELVSLGKMDDPGRIGKGLKLETLDLVKRQIDDMWRAAERRAISGQGTLSEAADLNELRGRFVKALDKADVTAKAGPNSTKAEGGAYKRARAAWAGPTHASDIMEEGLGAFSKKVAPEQITKRIAELTPGDKEAYMLGVNRALDEMTLSTTQGRSAANKLVHDEGAMELKLRAIFGDKADDYLRILESRKHFNETRNDVHSKSGPKTSRRISAKEDADTDTHPMIELLKGKPMNALQGLLSNVHKGLTQPNEAQLAELGPLLFDPAMKDTALHLVGSRANYNALLSKYLNQPVNQLTALGSGAYAGSSGQRP